MRFNNKGIFVDFHKKGIFEKSLNGTFISLIPKVEGGDDIKSFRPISLVGSVYKILSKVLASRLRKVLGRQILDAALIANECINSCIGSGNSVILCKLDIEKAYDHVSWSFLLATLEKMDFPSKWRNWISFCISTMHCPILSNAEASSFFSSSRGLRQGDPLLSLLFILVVETLSKLVIKAGKEGFLNVFRIGNPHSEGLLISYFLFANDTRVFCKSDESNVG